VAIFLFSVKVFWNIQVFEGLCGLISVQEIHFGGRSL